MAPASRLRQDQRQGLRYADLSPLRPSFASVRSLGATELPGSGDGRHLITAFIEHVALYVVVDGLRDGWHHTSAFSRKPPAGFLLVFNVQCRQNAAHVGWKRRGHRQTTTEL